MKRKMITCLLAAMLSIGTLSTLTAAPQDDTKAPIEVTADVLDYDSNTGLINAKGSVVITQNSAVIKGETAQLNSKTQESLISGNVFAVKDDMTLRSAELRGYENNTHLVATGNPILTKNENTVSGTHLEYYSANQFAVVTGGAILCMPDGVLTADKVEAYYNDDKAYGYGNVHIVSEPKNLDATSDHVVYTGLKTGNGVAVLTGNARAVQNGNVITGDQLTLHMEDKSIDAAGRPRLVITPQ